MRRRKSNNSNNTTHALDLSAGACSMFRGTPRFVPEKEVWSPAKNDLSTEVLREFCTRETFLWSVLKVDSNSRCTRNLTVIYNAAWGYAHIIRLFGVIPSCGLISVDPVDPDSGESPGSSNHDSLGTSDLPVATEPLAIRWQTASLPV